MLSAPLLTNRLLSWLGLACRSKQLRPCLRRLVSLLPLRDRRGNPSWLCFKAIRCLITICEGHQGACAAVREELGAKAAVAAVPKPSATGRGTLAHIAPTLSALLDAPPAAEARQPGQAVADFERLGQAAVGAGRLGTS